tara:strand:- start:212 stop:667 length:456 start_codon:yes stop_codon:yes gene_type:complete
MDDLEQRLAALQSGSPSHGVQAGQRLIISEPSPVMAEPYSCIIFTPDEAAKWYSTGGLHELLNPEFMRELREYFGQDLSIRKMSEPVKKLYLQYYLNSKSEPDKQIIKEAMERESGGASAGMPRAQGGGLKKKKRRKSKKSRKSKTRRRRR